VNALPASLHPGRETTAEVICSEEVFAGLRDEWNELLSASACDGVFLTWEWLHTWWRHLKGERALFLVAVRSGGRLVALAPLAVRPGGLRSIPPLRCLEMLGSGVAGSDHLDVLVRRGWEPESRLALAAALTGAAEVLALARMRGGPTEGAALAASLEWLGWSVRQTEAEVCPFIAQPAGGFAAYLTGLGAEHRYAFRRKLQALRRRGARLEAVTDEALRSAGLQSLIDLHDQRWRGRGASEAFNTAPLRAFHEEFTALALARGWLRLFSLQVEGAPVAALYGLRYGPVFSFYQSGFDPRWAKSSVGLVTLGLAIEAAFDEGAAEFDLLHGEESYKFHWASSTRRLRRLELFPPGLHGLIARAVSHLSQRARDGRRWLRSSPKAAPAKGSASAAAT
jgi:CelD/BcsL family acetyltransferase involved in cellulose biosynthesis